MMIAWMFPKEPKILKFNPLNNGLNSLHYLKDVPGRDKLSQKWSLESEPL